jgi:hypothetical protein
MNSRISCAVAVVAALGSVGMLSACSGGGLAGNQVVVHVEDNRDLAAATVVAQQTCAHRGGGQARMIAFVSPNNGGGGRFSSPDPQPPDAIFQCDPAR